MKTSTFSAAIAVVVATGFLASPAQAETKLRGVGIVSNQNALGALPRLVAVRSGNKIVLKDQQVRIPVRIGGTVKNASRHFVISFADVRSGGGQRFNVKPRSGDMRSVNASIVLPFRKKHYGTMGSNALKACNGYAGTTQTVIGFSFPLVLEVGAYNSRYKPEVGSPYTSWPGASVKSAKVVMQGEVVCPAAARPVRVSSVNLNIKRANAACPMKVVLAASIRTDKAGKTRLVLRRNDGATDTVDVIARKVGSHFIAHFKRGYTFKGAVARKYRFETKKGTPFTDWVDMKFDCRRPGGLAS
ncbi:hypothetical protein ACKTEK_14520 [Tepidamorphus sp. 3E244]|uniref:hypothetical protein n=1 Tax=Tepidamorphus sp. 3E244 TaxID=3385498 RepID=UPI0038FC5AC2